MTSQSVGAAAHRDPAHRTAAERRLERYGDRTQPGIGTAGEAVLGDAAMFYAVIPILVYVVMSEGGSKGVDDHDRVANLADRDHTPFEAAWGRLIDTLDLVAGIAFAEGKQRDQIAEAMREIHRDVEGTLEDGRRYHAWNKDLWAWTWAGIIKPPLDAYEKFHGPVSDDFSADYYIGALQLGDLIGVRGLPETYPEFLDYWENEWLPQAHGTGTAKYILDLARNLPLPAAAPWLPQPLWAAATWPARNLLITGAYLVMEPHALTALGVRPSRVQRASITAHTLVWRAVPRCISANLFGALIRARLKYGKLSWHHHYAPEALADYHQLVQSARVNGCPAPPRPSKRV